MKRVIFVLLISIILFSTIGTADISQNRWNYKNIKYLNTVPISNLLKSQQTLYPDMGMWMTLKIVFSDSIMTESISMAQAFFDSSDYNLNADTCWIDDVPMTQYYDSISGYAYRFDPFSNFNYALNHCYQFRVKGYGSIPPFIDTLRSPIHSNQLTSPQPYNIVIRGTSLAVQWVPQYEHNILIEVLDTAENTLLYYPLDDNGSYTIPASDFDTLETGLLYFMLGRTNQRTGIVPIFPLVSVTASMIQIPLYLQDAPAIEQETNRNIDLCKLEIYPNPAQSYLNIRLPQTLTTTAIKIYDVSGNLIIQTEISQPVTTISLRGINPGVYFVRVGSATSVRKLIITK
jgi:hypothetical protein